MTLAERLYAEIERGSHGFLFWLGVKARAEYVSKTVEYHFPDGSSLIRKDVDTENETVQAAWPKERAIYPSSRTAKSS